jgi:hypothetical protein
MIMELFRTLLGRPHLCVITRQPDVEMTQIQNAIEHKALVEGRADLEALFSGLLATDGERVPKTLDLIGHSTGKGFLKLGDWVIDASRPAVTAYFRELADNDVLLRLGIHSVRLLGCQTAASLTTRATIRSLSELLGVPVLGSTTMLFGSHYDAGGFVEQRQYLLVAADDFHDAPADHAETLVVRSPRILDLDALPATPLHASPSWPHRLASPEAVRFMLRLVRRSEGAPMPGLLAAPVCELALPSAEPGLYHSVQVLLGGAFVRVYPDGDHRPGIVYPVDDPHALHELVESLQLVTQRIPMK